MSSALFQLALLDAAHGRTTFNSGSEPLDRYLREQVTQDVRRRVAACFVALAEGQRIAGYYTLASASLLLADLPASTGKKLPRYPTVPAVRMGRLAVDQAFKGQGLGGALLADALDRAARSEIAAYALMVDAKDEAAAAFYLHHGFIALPDSPLTLFLPLATVPAGKRIGVAKGGFEVPDTLDARNEEVAPLFRGGERP
ncbi:GNAT family N-acetyltransferase [Aromatoleum bremense]|uniref:GNAT family N-acetyltransferase n=1 Tax=Aromatoleum bremense TaxID=76115 RepID=UPI001BB80361|nr:GNAT family N-acetyltransferase [Aromatoleum bremense]QTQ31272.1 Acetyltransferase (GNAT) domain-containing protein [Aromatoleum bremense]